MPGSSQTKTSVTPGSFALFSACCLNSVLYLFRLGLFQLLAHDRALMRWSVKVGPDQKAEQKHTKPTEKEDENENDNTQLYFETKSSCLVRHSHGVFIGVRIVD